MNGYKGCIVVQGPTSPLALSKIRECWDGYQLIFSTWVNDINTSLYTKDDIVIYNEYPDSKGVMNLNYQKKTTIAGFELAKSMGWDRAVKWRSDFWTNNADGLYNLFDKNSLNLYAWVNHLEGYITDYFMEGEIDDVITLFDIIPEGPYPEYPLTKQFVTSKLYTKTHFICDGISDTINIHWETHNFWFTDAELGTTFHSKLPENSEQHYK